MSEYTRILADLFVERDKRREAERYAEWLKKVFIQPHKEERKIFWSRVFRVLDIIRDESGQVSAEEKLQLIEAILTEYDDDTG